jgi:hypothetical protein
MVSSNNTSVTRSAAGSLSSAPDVLDFCKLGAGVARVPKYREKGLYPELQKNM